MKLLDFPGYISIAVILVMSFSALFFNGASELYWLGMFVCSLYLSVKKNFSKYINKVFFLILLILSFSFFSPFFDLKIFANTVAFGLINLVISNLIVDSKQKGIIIAKFTLITFGLIFILSITATFFSTSESLLRFDHNSFFLKVRQNFGLNKQELGVLGTVPILSFFYAKKKSKLFLLFPWLMLCFVMLGFRSITFGLIILIILELLSNLGRKFLIISLPISHLGFAFVLQKTDFLDFFFQVDPRWGMQLLSIDTSQKYFLGIGYGGWNEFVVINKVNLIGFLDYFPIWMPYKTVMYIPTTLESSFFQLSAEIGIFMITCLYFYLGLMFIRSMENEMNLIRLLSRLNLVILFSSFYEDNLFQPIWYIFLSLYLGIICLRKKIV